MTSDVDDLYQQVIIDHQRSPRNFGPLENANLNGEGFNPLCGDRFIVHLKVEDDVIQDVKFEGAGCAISVASASMMTEAIRGRSKAEVEELFDKFHALIMQEPSGSANAEALGKLAVFKGIWEYPVRVKCASLAWHTMNSAIHQEEETATTE